MNPLKELERHGQAVWLDFVARGFIAQGDLKRLIDEDGLKGVTSNPAIFEKAIGHTDEYDEGIRRALSEDAGIQTVPLYETLAVADIKAAADVLRPVYDATGGTDGYVSLEVSPYLAMNAEETLTEARRLWQWVDRRNLMVKVPGTAPCLPAIRKLTSEGININITLLFSQAVYREVAEGYLAGLEELIEKGGDPSRMASVASFFVSRIDSEVDKQLEAKGAAKELAGKTAIANAKLAYRDYQRLFSGPRWEGLKAKGARPQRLLWASTGTKNPALSDVLYVEELIGPDTVNTMPPATLEAFRDHGRARASLTEDVGEAERVLAAVAEAGVKLDDVTAKLVEQGVKLFADAADKLMAGLEGKRASLTGG